MARDLSVIIPTRNRASALTKCVTSLVRGIPIGAPVEIIVVDNGSSDDTRAAYTAVKAAFPRHDWRYFFDEIPGLLTGRHRGAIEARGEILAYLDDDVLVTPNWLRALNESFNEPKTIFAGGPVIPCFDIEPPPWLDGMWIRFAENERVLGELSLLDLGDKIREVDPLYIAGGNCSIRRTAFFEAGGFHPDGLPDPLLRYRGDGETGLALKLKSRGLKAVYHPGMALHHVITTSRLRPESFERKAFSQGISDSYATIRQKGLHGRTQMQTYLYRARALKWSIQREFLLMNLTPSNMRFLTARARIAGRHFHEREVRNDPDLLRWVLKPNYVNYSLPFGWERYLDRKH